LKNLNYKKKTIPGIQVRKIDFALMPYPGSDIPSLPQG